MEYLRRYDANKPIKNDDHKRSGLPQGLPMFVSPMRYIYRGAYNKRMVKSRGELPRRKET